MGQYVLRRILLIVPTLFVVSAIVFATVRLLPGDVVNLMLQENQYAKSMEELRAKLGLSKPIYVQYVEWLGQVGRGNLGKSLWTGQSAISEIWKRLPVTAELSLMAIVISLVIAVPVGIVSAVRQDTWLDYALRTFAIAGLAIPSFWLATMVVVLPSIWFRWSPALRFEPFTKDPLANLLQFAIPAAILGAASGAAIMRMTRAMMLEVMRQDYIRTAHAKGLTLRAVIYGHALKNAMIPVITVVGLQMPFYFGGSIIIESIFGLPGMGRFMLEVLMHRDYPMLQALNLFIASSVVVTNLVVDVSYAFLNPRIRYQ